MEKKVSSGKHNNLDRWRWHFGRLHIPVNNTDLDNLFIFIQQILLKV
jgi:hypothetical protein